MFAYIPAELARAGKIMLHRDPANMYVRDQRNICVFLLSQKCSVTPLMNTDI